MLNVFEYVWIDLNKPSSEYAECVLYSTRKVEEVSKKIWKGIIIRAVKASPENIR